MYKLRSHRMRDRLVPLLSFVLLLQGLLPVQMHSRLELDDKGRLVEVCTLEGMQLRTLDGDNIYPDGSTKRSDRSPAMAFSQVMAEATPDISELIVVHPSTKVLHTPEPPVFSVSVVTFGLLPIRAPPIA